MSKEEKKDNRVKKNDEGRRGGLWLLIDFPIAIVSALFLSAFISYLIEAVGMFFEWWDLPGVLHSQKMVVSELGYLNDRLDKSVIEWMSGVSVKEVFDSSVGSVAEFFGFIGVGEYAQGDYRGGIGAYIGAFVNIVILTFIRFLVFVFALPLFFINAWVGFVIGAFERDKRRAGIGRESGAIFQFTRRSVPFTVGIPLFLYLAWPDSIDPLFIIYPFAAFFGIMVAYATASYRKYM
ncbi:integrating conjugative element membrane protein [Alteromonas sp. KUL42]|uniref:DUF4400 domain-containing protein n=1 Tax=Alteromonas sp. KUL42 TaxID=2480797 RepID=UPI0010FFB809|nr:DUF4400 domain-containing protein [Alteromonas sp. KUL42]GEA09122.1 integrating conjugative element membrane protein [Alteromonas sp. KUL42]